MKITEKELRKMMLKEKGIIISEEDVQSIYAINNILNLSMDVLDLTLSFYSVLSEQFKELCSVEHIPLSDEEMCNRFKSTMDNNLYYIEELSKTILTSDPNNKLINLLESNKELITLLQEKKYIK